MKNKPEEEGVNNIRVSIRRESEREWNTKVGDNNKPPP